MATGGTTLKFSFFGDEQINRTIVDREERVEDARPAWEVLAGRFGRAEARQFKSEGSYGSGGWAPLKPTYGAWKARNYPGKTILRRTDDLFKSLTQRPYGIEVIEPSYMILGSDVEYGGYHQRGDGQKQRRPVELPEAERREWVRLLQRYLVLGRVR
jgi:phage gpG-like protein